MSVDAVEKVENCYVTASSANDEMGDYRSSIRRQFRYLSPR